MTTVRAIQEVRRNPFGAVESTGEFDADGNMIFRAIIEVHAPGKTFEIDDATELAFLIDAGAVDYADAPYYPNNGIASQRGAKPVLQDLVKETLTGIATADATHVSVGRRP